MGPAYFCLYYSILFLFVLPQEPHNITRFSIREDSTSDFFLVDSVTGAVSLKRSLLKDTKESYEVTWLQLAIKTQLTQNMCIAFLQRWTNVEDVRPTLYKCYTNVLYMLGMRFGEYLVNIYHTWSSIMALKDFLIYFSFFYFSNTLKLKFQSQHLETK